MSYGVPRGAEKVSRIIWMAPKNENLDYKGNLDDKNLYWDPTSILDHHKDNNLTF